MFLELLVLKGLTMLIFRNEEIDCNNEYLNHFSLNPNLNEAVETEEGYDQ